METRCFNYLLVITSYAFPRRVWDEAFLSKNSKCYF